MWGVVRWQPMAKGQQPMALQLRKVAARYRIRVVHELGPAPCNELHRRWRWCPWDAAHHHASVRLVLHEALGFQAAERFPDRRLRDAPLRGDLLLPEVLAGLEPAGEDRLL